MESSFPSDSPEPRPAAAMATGDPEHDACWQLLPWLANDRLAGDELARVLDHLKSCALCRQELAFLPELRCAVEEAYFADDPGDRSSHGHRHVMDRIDAYERQQVTPSPAPREPWVRGLLQRWRQLLHGSWGPRLVLAQALVIALLAVPWATQLLSTSPPAADGATVVGSEFRTLTSAAETSVEGDLLRLVFKPQTLEGELRRLMLDVGAELVAGPTPRGVYTARLANGQGSEALAALRQAPQVDFAELVVGSP